MSVSRNPVVTDKMLGEMRDLAAMQAEDLHPDLVPWVEESGSFGPMLRHPLVYQVPLYNAGVANRVFAGKKARIETHAEAGDWHTVVFMHERPYRLKAFIDYCTGYDGETGEILPLTEYVNEEYRALAADVWVDSENINQNLDEWRALIAQPGDYPTGLWLGTEDERAAFEALPWDEDDCIQAWRGGVVGDWSWTTSISTAQFFSRQSGHPVRTARINKAECFGYLTRRSENELLVMYTPEREALVYL